jgi:uncharacterized protein YndB with AHSA1/START domain
MSKITVQNTIYSDIETTWKVWTSPEFIIQWNFASDDWHCPEATNDLRVGGTYHTRMEAKDGSFGFDFDAIYDEVIPFKKLSYCLADGRNCTTTFTTTDEGTIVTTVFDAEGENDKEMQQQGWQAILDNFKKVAESQ